MRRVTALCAALGMLASIAPAFARPHALSSGYYLIRYDNTGACQIWNTNLTMKPLHWPSDYKVLSKPVATVTEALAIKQGLLQNGGCRI
jgi:hypothetical protein